jgi:hypothetical protein
LCRKTPQANLYLAKRLQKGNLGLPEHMLSEEGLQLSIII